MRRKAQQSSTDNDSEESSDLISLEMRNKNPQKPPAEQLMQDATKHGLCQKRNNSMLAYFLPCFFPKWKTRFLILVGNYLFRYSSEHGDSPKGVPIPIDSVTCRMSEEANCFEVSMIRKVYTFRLESEEDCRSWIKAINERRGASIRENLGHSPTSSSVKMINKAGATLFSATLMKDSAGISETSNPLQNAM